MSKFGRFALIAYIFTFVLVVVAILLQQNIGVVLLSGWSYDAVNTLIGNHELNVEERSDLIFGNFWGSAQAVATLLFQGVTGGLLFDVFQQIPFLANDSFQLVIRGLITFSSFMLGLEVITGRSL